MGKIIGGSAFGRDDSIVDTSEAVLLDAQTVVLVGALRPDGAETVIGMELGGRINHSNERSDVLYLLNADGAAAIISDLLGLAGRADPTFLAQLLARIDELPREGSE
jgi:hypothetical protein